MCKQNLYSKHIIMEKENKLLLALLRIVVKKQVDESIPSDVDWEKLMNIATTQVVCNCA